VRALLELENGLVKLTIRGSAGTASVLLIGGVEGIRAIVSPDGQIHGNDALRDARVAEAFAVLAEGLVTIAGFYDPCLVLEEQAFALAEEISNAERGLIQLPPGTTIESLSQQIEQIQAKLDETDCGAQPPRPALSCSTGLEMQYQQMYEWCWIAAATSTSLFYDPASTWTQCSLISAVLQLTCCPPASPAVNPYDPAALYDLQNLVADPTCDHSGGVKDALTKTGNLHEVVAGPVPLPHNQSGSPSIVDEICAGRPIMVSIDWTGSGAGGHVVAIAGFDGELLYIVDPIYGEQQIYYEVFPAYYQGGATWVSSSLTQPA